MFDRNTAPLLMGSSPLVEPSRLDLRTTGMVCVSPDVLMHTSCHKGMFVLCSLAQHHTAVSYVGRFTLSVQCNTIQHNANLSDWSVACKALADRGK